jgi:hypothetical protein|tara:strand:- start:1803 stop:2036 length:234 start_codon:yes stop_codon:yes gene_type:complete
MRKLKKDNTIEEVAAIIRGDQSTRKKRLHGAMAGLMNEGGVTTTHADYRPGSFNRVCRLVPICNAQRGLMRGNGNTL